MTEKEYIERGALLADLQEEIEFETAMYTAEQNDYFNRGLKCALKDVRRHPAADVAPVVHAEWIPHEHVSRSPYARNYDCSACGNSPIETGDFCNKCGAMMDGGKDG